MKKTTKPSRAKAKRGREAMKALMRERSGRAALNKRGLVIHFGDPLTPDELRSMYLVSVHAVATATPEQLAAMLPGITWLGMLFDAGASMLPGDHFKKHHEFLALKNSR